MITLLDIDTAPANKERGTSRKIGVVAEPVNLLTNVIFMLAGIISLQYCELGLDYLLAFHIFMIGVNSFVAHLHYNNYTTILDNLTIVSFVVFYVAVFLYNMIDIGDYAHYLMAAWLALGYFCCFTKARNWWNAGFDFVPVLVALWGAAIYSVLYHDTITFFTSAVLGTIALAARVVDTGTTLKCGTHFMWHIFAGTLLLNLMLTKLFW